MHLRAANQAVQRTGASRFAQRQIGHPRRLAPVADLCVRLVLRMKKTATIVLILLATVFAAPAGTTNVTAVIKGKPVELNPDIRARVAQKAVGLLASCAYVNRNPKWGATPTAPKSMADAKKESHLHFDFTAPVKVEVPIEKVTVQVHEMVISLPLATAGIWVRTGDRVMYFAMFDHTAAEGLGKVLAEVQKP